MSVMAGVSRTYSTNPRLRMGGCAVRLGEDQSGQDEGRLRASHARASGEAMSPVFRHATAGPIKPSEGRTALTPVSCSIPEFEANQGSQMKQVGVCTRLTDEPAERFGRAGILDRQPDFREPSFRRAWDRAFHRQPGLSRIIDLISVFP